MKANPTADVRRPRIFALQSGSRKLPASMRRTIAVAGSAYGRVTWGRSAYGPTVDWSAPAKDLYRANMKKLSTPIYGDGDGTSYATAITSGAAALWLAHHGSTLADTYPQPWQRVAAFKAAAKATAVPMDNQQPGSFGAGILNIGALLDYPLPALDPVQEDPA